MSKKYVIAALVLFLTLFAEVGIGWSLTAEEELGKAIYFDKSLSINGNQSCASCHAPESGWTGNDSLVNETTVVYEGSIPHRFGNRKPPSAAYATPSPVFDIIRQGQNIFVGGNFWDGRATGETLGNPSAEQAIGPFLNPVEQGLPDNACVVYKVCTAQYDVTFEQVWGPEACAVKWPSNIESMCKKENKQVDLTPEDRALVIEAYNNIGLTIAAYEGSAEVNQYTSKYDYYLQGLVQLTPEEQQGLKFFKGKGKCAKCHTLTPGPNGEPPLLTDYTFDNLGVPKNVDNPWYIMDQFNPLGENWIDLGLGGFLASRTDYQQYAPENNGKHKVPTLRNVDKRPATDFVKAYMHNGYFKSLKSVVHFYNTRDVKPACDDPLITEAEALAQNCWPAPEVAANVNTKDVGNLKLTEWQEDAIVAFMKTLTDGYELP